MKIVFGQLGLIRGWTRVDALMGGAALLVLAALLYAGIWVGGEQRRIWVCAHHLKTLGGAFTAYAQDHGDALPPEVFDDGTTRTSWDQEIAPYLKPQLAKSSLPSEQQAHLNKVAYIFKCPSDREPRGGASPRSYAMPIYDINRLGWPAKPESAGGLGLHLDVQSIAKARAADTALPPDALPAIKVSAVPAPAGTALLVERINILNALWQPNLAGASSAKEQFEARTFEPRDFHGGKMNYLMLDGQVELLSLAQSEGLAGGVWTMRIGD